MNRPAWNIAQCHYCGAIHCGVVCPRVKALDYYPDGSIKRVEFRDEQPQVASEALGLAAIGALADEICCGR